jgi:hypothetical protein
MGQPGTVPMTYSTIATMDEKFPALVPCDFASSIDSLLLCFVDRGNAGVARAPHCPRLPVWDNMLISSD